VVAQVTKELYKEHAFYWNSKAVLEGVELVRTFCGQGKVNFSRFYADALYGRPPNENVKYVLGDWVRCAYYRNSHL